MAIARLARVSFVLLLLGSSAGVALFSEGAAFGQFRPVGETRTLQVLATFESVPFGSLTSSQQQTAPPFGLFDVQIGLGQGPAHPGFATPTARQTSSLAADQRTLHVTAAIDANAAILDQPEEDEPRTFASAHASAEITFTVDRVRLATLSGTLAATTFASSEAQLLDCPAPGSANADCAILIDVPASADLPVTIKVTPHRNYRLRFLAGGSAAASFERPFHASMASFDLSFDAVGP